MKSEVVLVFNAPCGLKEGEGTNQETFSVQMQVRFVTMKTCGCGKDENDVSAKTKGGFKTSVDERMFFDRA